MKTSEVFKRVRQHLYNGKDDCRPTHRHFICEAIKYLYYEAKVIGDMDRTRAQRIIIAELQPHHTLEDWLAKQHKIIPTYTPAYRRKIMVTRKAWLTHLINHYQSKGD